MLLFSSSVGKRIRPYFLKFFGVNALISRFFNMHHWFVYFKQVIHKIFDVSS